jgi:osmotically-inducible protein OsmY
MIQHCEPDNFCTEEACTKATAALASSSIRDLRGLNVRSDQGSLQVSGRVASFYHKQVALETVRSVAGNLRIQNIVDVR